MSVRAFASPAAFAMFLGSLPARIEREQERGLDRAAKIIQDEAKREFGTYQDAVGPFSAWPALAEATIEDRIRKGFTPNDPLLRSGELRAGVERSVSKDEANIGSDSQIAVYQELGTQKIPPRSTLGGAAARKADQVAEILGRAMTGRLTGEGVSMGLIGSED